MLVLRGARDFGGSLKNNGNDEIGHSEYIACLANSLPIIMSLFFRVLVFLLQGRISLNGILWPILGENKGTGINCGAALKKHLISPLPYSCGYPTVLPDFCSK